MSNKISREQASRIVVVLMAGSIIFLLLCSINIRYLTSYDKTERLNFFECLLYKPCRNLSEWNNNVSDIILAKKIADDFSEKQPTRFIYRNEYLSVNIVKEHKTSKITSRYVDGKPIYESNYTSEWRKCKDQQSHSECIKEAISNYK